MLISPQITIAINYCNFNSEYDNAWFFPPLKLDTNFLTF